MLKELLELRPAAACFTISSRAETSPVGPEELLRRIECAAAQLQSARVKPGERILFSGEQGLPAFVTFWATVATGAAFVPIDPTWPLPMRRKALEKARPGLVIVEDADDISRWPLSASCAPALIHVDAYGALGMPLAPAGFAPVTTSAEMAAACLFTSGSTGDPKVVVLSRQALLHSAALVVDTFEWQRRERLVNLPDPHTMSGLRNAFLAAPLAGMEWQCSPRPSRAELSGLLDLLVKLRPERLVAAPMLLRYLNLLGDRVDAGILASVKALYCTGSDLNQHEVKQFHARFGIPVINYYGMTETVGLCLSQRLQNWEPGDTSIGSPVSCEVRVVDAHGEPVPRGDAGELQVRLAYPMTGYLDDPGATADRFDGAWLRTGDLVIHASDGRVTITGRSASFIKTTATERVQPQEIEVVLEQCPGVAEAAAFGLPDAGGGELIAVLLVADPEIAESCLPSEAELATFARNRLGPGRSPRIFQWVLAIPRNTGGKILRGRLRDSLDASRSR